MISWALKEWAIAVEALLAGELILLIRKGGIHEGKAAFTAPSDRFFLFPTHEHQQAPLLRSPYRERLTPQPVPQVGDPVSIQGWAHVTHQIPLAATVDPKALRPFHIWTDAWLQERLAWKPERPAYCLLLQAHRFNVPLELPYQKQYGGCRSWVTIDGPTALPDSVPVMPETVYQEMAQRIASVLL